MPDGMTAAKPRSRLKAVAPELVEPKKPKVLVFGAPGVGKTWASLDFPSVFYVDTEGGADLNHYREKLARAGGVYFGPEQGSLDFQAVIEQVQALATEEHPYRTIVFDSITKLFQSAIAEESERLGDKDAFGASKKQPIRRMAQLVRWVNRLDMSAIFICHQKELWGIDDKGNRTSVGYTADAWEKLEYELHLVLQVIKTGPTRRARIGKSRLTGFPEGETFEWSYEKFAERYGRDVIEKAAQAITLADDAQVAEVLRLLQIIKVPDDWPAKVFKKYEVEEWTEMKSEDLTKIINQLKEKLA